MRLRQASVHCFDCDGLEREMFFDAMRESDVYFKSLTTSGSKTFNF